MSLTGNEPVSTGNLKAVSNALDSKIEQGGGRAVREHVK